MKKVGAFIKRLLGWLLSKKGIVSTGVATLAFALVTATFIILPYVSANSPGLYSGEDFRQLRSLVLRQGQPSEDTSGIARYRSSEFVVLEAEGKEATLTVSPESTANDFFEFRVDKQVTFLDEEYRFRIFIGSQLFCYVADNDPLYMNVEVVHADGSPLVLPEIGMTSHVSALFSWNRQSGTRMADFSDRLLYFDEDAAKACQEEALRQTNIVAKEFPRYPEAFGYADGETFLNETVALFGRVNAIVGLSRIAIYSSVLMVASGSLCLGSAIVIASAKKRGREPLSLLMPSSEEGNGIQEDTPLPESSFDLLVRRSHLRPVFGEWFFRAIGLVLVAVSSLMLALFATAFEQNWGQGWEDLSLSTSDVFANISTVGTFMLLVAVIGIISETRRNLHVSAWAFITLSVGYYLFSCTSLFSYEISSGYLGHIMADNVAMDASGNVFLGIGLFAITGFFLFHNPDPCFVNRRLFRSLCLIPTAIALLSVIFTYLYRTMEFTPSYWVKNILFIRDSAIVFMGIFYEYSIFVYRQILKRRYGEKNLERALSRPGAQLQKNIALCLVVLLFTMAFYLIPVEERRNFGFLSTQAFYFVLIPFFLFYKPAGKNHKLSSDVIYYVLYAIAWALPSIPGLITSLSGLIA